MGSGIPLTNQYKFQQHDLSTLYYLSLVKLHTILRHTRLDDLSELGLIDNSVTIWIINLGRHMTRLIVLCLINTLNKNDSFSSSPWRAN